MNKYILPIIIIVGLIFGYFVYRSPSIFRQSTPEVSSSSTNNLPKDWLAVTAEGVELKLEKAVTDGIKPQIVLTVTTSEDASSTPAKYTDNLLAGAKSAIPSLRFTSDKRGSLENLYTANLAGYYYNQKNKIDLIQRVYIQKSKVSVLTASFSGDLSKEIDEIFDTLQKEKLGL